MARKNSLERQEPRKKPREEPGSEGWPVLFWLCRVEIKTEHGQDVQTFIDDQQGQIIIISTVVVINNFTVLKGIYIFIIFGNLPWSFG